jgi:uncharacterized protein (TIGR02231 family)
MEFPVKATVNEVIVYPDRARVTCLGQCELPEGIHTITVGELPLVLDPESIRATGMGTARVRLRGVEIVQRYYVVTPDAKVHALEEQIEALQDQLRTLTDRQTVWRSSIEHINGLREATKEFAWGLARGRSTIENQAALMRYFEEEDTQIRQNIHDLEVSERALHDQLVKLQKELDAHQTARPRQRYEARLEVEVLGPGKFQPELTYNVSRAGWRPLYDIRLEESSKAASKANLSFTSLAEIFQNTGQDWLGVELVVSTARPALNQRVPELKPWFIDVPRPQPRLAKSVGMAAMRETVQDFEGAELSAPLMSMPADAVPVAAEADVAQLQDSGTTVSFRVYGRIDIPGDGSTRKTTIGQYDLVPDLDYLSIPRHTSAAYRRAKLNNTTTAPILPGPVNLYVGDEFIGRNRLEYTPPSGELELILGVEERIAVKRELLRRDVDKRLLRDTRQVVFAYEIELENHLSEEVPVTIKDQYPVSRHEQIKVRLDNVTPQPSEQTDLHLIEWQMSLEPGQKETIRFEYQIEHPRDLVVGGLID